LNDAIKQGIWGSGGLNRRKLTLYKDKKVLVTGGTGLVGRPLVELLLQAGAKVRVASLDDESRCPKGVEFMRGNLIHWDFCQKIVKDVDYVFHVAGIKGSVGIGNSKAASFFVPLLLFNTHMMEAAKQAGVKRYLFTSSIAVYPPVDVFIEDNAWDDAPHPSDKYAAWAKRIGELQAEAYKLEYGWDKVAIVRPANVYGPYDNFDAKTAMVIPALIRRVVDGENPLVVWGDGSEIRDFIFSRDVAKGMLLALEKGANCIPINLGSGQRITIKEVVETIIRHIPNPPTIRWDKSKKAKQRVRLMDTTRAKKMIGFEAMTTLSEGIKETIDWYFQNEKTVDNRYNVFRNENYME
jgi:GDP-L-fucose synthase